MDLGAGDSVTIYDGDKPTDTVLARYTGDGSDAPQFVMTTGDSAYVYMDTSSFEAGSGFKFSYKMGTHSLGFIFCVLFFSLVLSLPSPSFLHSVPHFSSHAHTTSTSFSGHSLVKISIKKKRFLS